MSDLQQVKYPISVYLVIYLYRDTKQLEGTISRVIKCHKDVKLGQISNIYIYNSVLRIGKYIFWAF